MSLIQHYLRRHPARSKRIFEILPGFVSWFLILFPIWGSIVIPQVVAVYIITFTVFWLYKSISTAILSLIGHFRLEASKRFDWMGDVAVFPDWKRIQHIIVIPTYQEPLSTITRSINSLKRQTFPRRRLHVIVSFEKREGPPAQKKARLLRHKFKSVFGSFSVTFHHDLPGETKGKSSNTAWAARTIVEEKLIKKQMVDIDSATITSQDADAVLHPNYFAALTYNFLDHPRRYFVFWQAGIFYYNNIWQVPAPIRVLATVWSVVHIYLLMRRDRLINFSTYSASLKLIRSVGYWDTNVIPEDWRIFFKAFFATKGKTEVRPIFLPVSMDAAQSTSFWRTMKNQYEQVKRWAWGAADDQYVIRGALLTKGLPFGEKFLRLAHLVEDHFLWPVNWFALTLGALLPPLLNPDFARTVIGKTLPQTSSRILTISLVSILVILAIDAKQRPKRPARVSKLSRCLQPLELILLPVISFFFNALPGLDAHTRLMLGKYIEYKVTEKV